MSIVHIGPGNQGIGFQPEDLGTPSPNILSYLDNCKILSTVAQEDDYEGWKAARGRGIGGSEIGAICGVSNFATARSVYLRKTAQYDEDFDNAAIERMTWGRVLEPFVADEYARRTGNIVKVSPATLVHNEHEWAIANIDRFIVDAEGKPYGILECKTAGEHMNGHWDEGEIPTSYIYQLNWYLWITGLKYGAFACLVGGNKFYFYEMYRDDDLLKNEMIPAAGYFWNYYVKNMIEPPLSGSQADTDYVKEKYGDVVKNSEIALPDDDTNDLVTFIKEGKKQLKELEGKVEEASNRLKNMLGNTEIGYTQDYTIKWSPREQERVDMDKLRADFPQTYEKVKKKIRYRVLTIK